MEEKEKKEELPENREAKQENPKQDVSKEGEKNGKNIAKTPKPSKELTPAELQRRKKLIVFPIMALAFAGCMYLIFTPSAPKEEEAKSGFNPELPLPQQDDLVGDKIQAYEQAQASVARNERMKTLQDFVFDNGTKTEEVETPMLDNEIEDNKSSSSVSSSTEAYKKMNRQLADFYQPAPSKEDDQKTLELEWRIQKLEKKLEVAESTKNTTDEQLELMEKSYQMAAKYMGGQPNGQQLPTGKEVATLAENGSKKPVAGKVSAIREQAVSRLDQSIADSVLIAAYSKPRNTGFNTAVGNRFSIPKNTIKACIHEEQTLTDGQNVRLRLLEPLRAGEFIIPTNSLVTGTGKIEGERLDIEILSLEYQGNIIPVELAVHDVDGNRGLYVPSSMEREAVNEALANVGAGLGTSISFASSAGQQIAMDLTRGVMQGGSQYLAKKFRTVKVKLKANYQVMLYSKEQ